MEVQEHIIKKLVMDVSVGEQREAIHLQDTLVSFTEQEFLKVIDTVFSKFSLPGEMIEIDSLTIDLGRIRQDFIVQDLMEKIMQKLSEELTKRIKQEDSSKYHLSGLPVAKPDIEVVVYFLRYGHLPWWNKKVVKVSQLFEELLEHERKSFVLAVAQELKKERSAHRFVQQVELTQRIAFLASAVPHRYSAIRMFLEKTIVPLLQTIPIAKQQESMKLVWRTIVSYFVLNDFSEFLNEDMELQVEKTLNDYGIEVSLNVERVQKIRKISDEKRKSMDSPTVDEREELKGAFIDRNANGTKVSKDKEYLQEGSEEQFVKRKVGTENEEEHYSEEQFYKEEVYIENAGLVLFWPYLTTFFRALGLLEKNEFKDEYSKNKALYVVGSLASGLDVAEEHQLMLCKILCGWEMEQVPDFYQLSQEEMEEAENLTRAVIEHWKVLRNTTTEGLRETFIRREGILVFKEGSGWHLRIERKGVDVLMGALPWGISIIRLTWMDYTLHVEW